MPSPSAIPINPLARALSSQLSSQLSRTPAPSLQTVPSQKVDLTREGAETTSELDLQLRKSTTAARAALAEVAYCVYRLSLAEEWGSLGFSTEEEYSSSLGYTPASWDSYRTLGERLSHLSLPQMREIPVNSAKLLAGISVRIWGEFAWAEEAQILSAKEFASLVRERLGKSGRGGKLERGLAGLEEAKSVLKLALPALRKDDFEQRIDSLRRRERLHSAAEVLDFALRSAEKDPARVGLVENLFQLADELSQTWEGVGAEISLADPEASSFLAAKTHAQSLLRQIQKSLKELRRYAPKSPSLQVEVARDQNSHRTNPAQA